MRIVTVGASYATASLELLEQLSIAPGELDAVLAEMKPFVREVFVLSTCNRTEFYAVLDDSAGIDAVVELLDKRAGLYGGSLRAQLLMQHGSDAVRHALRVASGLDSMVLGEDQVQAQMKRALAAARGAETLGPMLERLGAAALGCGKRVRAFTGVGQHSVSLESIAVDAALGGVGSLHGQQVLVLGSGSSAGTVSRQLQQHGANVTIVGRSQGATSALASDIAAAHKPWEDLHAALVQARVVFSCTSAPHPVLTRETLAQRLTEAPGAPLLCVDLGMPHDVDPGIATIPGMSILSLAELGGVAATHRAARARHVPDAEAIVERETERFLDWLRARDAAPAIAISRARAEALADTELKRALARLQTANAHDRAVVAELARRLARKLMHQRTTDLKLGADALLPADSLTEREEAVS